jgi:hypothetical protein
MNLRNFRIPFSPSFDLIATNELIVCWNCFIFILFIFFYFKFLFKLFFLYKKNEKNYFDVFVRFLFGFLQ